MSPKIIASLILIAAAVTAQPAAADELGDRGQTVLSCPIQSWSSCVSAQRFDGGSYTSLALGADDLV